MGILPFATNMNGNVRPSIRPANCLKPEPRRPGSGVRNVRSTHLVISTRTRPIRRARSRCFERPSSFQPARSQSGPFKRRGANTCGRLCPRSRRVPDVREGSASPRKPELITEVWCLFAPRASPLNQRPRNQRASSPTWKAQARRRSRSRASHRRRSSFRQGIQYPHLRFPNKH